MKRNGKIFMKASKMHRFRLFQLLTLLILFTGLQTACVSMSSLQTARTLEEGQTQNTFGGGVYQSKDTINDIEYESNLPYLEYSYRHGIIKNLDGGLKVTFIGAYSGDIKYQLVNGEQWALSTGLGLGYMSYKIKSGDQESTVKFLDWMVPLYLSYDIAKSWSLYMTPKYIYRSISGDSSGSDNITGLALGTKIGELSGVYLEAAMVKGKDSNAITQYNISYFW